MYQDIQHIYNKNPKLFINQTAALLSLLKISGDELHPKTQKTIDDHAMNLVYARNSILHLEDIVYRDV